MKNQEGHWGVLLMSLGRKNERFNVKKKLHMKTDDNGNAMFQSYLSKLFKKETG